MTSKQDSAQNPSANPSPVRPSLEDLLRLKRAERPDEAFWSDFDRGMRQKQLAAIIEPRPWWLGMSLWWRKASPVALPLAAGAAAALAVMVMRDDPGASDFASTGHFGRSTEETLVAVDVKPSAPVVVTKSVDASDVESVPVQEFATGRDEVPSVTALSVGDERFAEQEPAVPVVAAAATATVVPPSTSIIQATLEAIAAEPLVAMAGSGILPVTDVEPKAVVALAGRQERLLAMADLEETSTNPESLATLRERMAHRFGSDERRLASASRVGLGVDRLSLRF